MALEVFPYELYPPTYGADEQTTDAILVPRFGDGYEQSVPDGINYQQSSWSLSWDDHKLVDADFIWRFLRPKVKLAPFMWKTPDMTAELQVKCTALSRSWPKHGVRSIKATFVTNHSY